MKITRKSTLIILDWDDTLFPTTWITRNNIDLANPYSRERHIVYFTDLDSALVRVFNVLIKYGKVVIVTNAMPEWVRISSSILPRTHKILSKIKIVSARKSYQEINPDSMSWKTMAFVDELSKEMKEKQINNVISVGDAEYEYQALINLYKNDRRGTKIMKSIRFMKDPTQDVLLDQLDVLQHAISKICGKNKHLDLKFKQKLHNIDQNTLF